MSQSNAYKEFLDRYYDDPVDFCINLLKVEPIEWQANLLRELAKGTRRISAKSGHGCGKSAVTSWSMLWMLLTRYPIKIVATSPTQSQLFDVLGAEIKRWIKELPAALSELLIVKSERIELASSPTEAFIALRNSRKDQPDALQGIHSATTYLVVDEAAGVDEAVFEAAYGSMSSPNAHVVLLGNPTKSTGYFFQTHHQNKANWHCMTVSCLDSPLVAPAFIQEMEDTYGKSSNQFRTRILGLFPLEDQDTVIPRGMVEDAVKRTVEVPDDYGEIWGLDVARMGADQSVLCMRQGRLTKHLIAFEKLDLMTLAGRVENLYNKAGHKPLCICCDGIGLGAGVVDRLSQILPVPVYSINVSESPISTDVYANLRAELWFTARDYLKAGNVSLPDQQRLVEDLCSPRFEYKANGTLALEPKQMTARRLGSSPDWADAFILTFASPKTDASGMLRPRRIKTKRTIGGIV